MRKAFDLLYAAGLWLAAFSMVAAAVLVIIQIVGRLAGFLVPSVPELAGFLLGATIFLALAGTQRVGEHIRVTLVIERLGPVWAWLFEVLYRLIGLPLLVMLCWYMGALAYDSWDFGDRSAGMIGIPYWMPQLMMSIGVLLLCLRFIDELIQLLIAGRVEMNVKISDAELGAS
jgi:TRAP-type C4-dicarboxylate transport system permease small subunit